MMQTWMAARLRTYTESVFDETNALAEQYGAVNLASGTPDDPTPEIILQAAQRALAEGHNQYAPVRGEMVLRKAIAAHAERFYSQQLDPASEISITSGVTEGIFAAAVAFVEPGDEVIVFEPFYDCYVPAIEMAGGKVIPVTLHAPDYDFDADELRAAFSLRTRALILNTPHNPTGKVFSVAELTLVSELCQEFDVLAITDEVYEHVVFDEARHVRLATLPGMRDRTLTLSGAGKTFTCTGWRIGWAIGPPVLQDALARLRQFTVFSSPTPLQFAVAAGFDLPNDYFRKLAADYQARRDFLLTALNGFGLRPSKPPGSFFTLADISGLARNGSEFCRDLAREVGVVPIPLDTFYFNRQLGEKTARFTFCRQREQLAMAVDRLQCRKVCG
jgi:N-succinyldiaminopimelate aminotransferase